MHHQGIVINGEINIIGIGDGEKNITLEALECIKAADVIIGYEGFVNQLSQYFRDDVKIINDKSFRKNGINDDELMLNRANISIDEALKGKRVTILSGGDMGIYTPLLIILSAAHKREFYNINCIPGIPFFISAAAKIGVPLVHGFALIGLFLRRMTDEYIFKKIEGAALGDYVMVIYVPVPEATLLPELIRLRNIPQYIPSKKKVENDLV